MTCFLCGCVFAAESVIVFSNGVSAWLSLTLENFEAVTANIRVLLTMWKVFRFVSLQ